MGGFFIRIMATPCSFHDASSCSAPMKTPAPIFRYPQPENKGGPLLYLRLTRGISVMRSFAQP